MNYEIELSKSTLTRFLGRERKFKLQTLDGRTVYSNGFGTYSLVKRHSGYYPVVADNWRSNRFQRDQQAYLASKQIVGDLQWVESEE